MSGRNPTLFWTPGAEPPPVVTGGPLSTCPSCQSSTAGLPFCGRDGTITSGGPFPIGERYLGEELLGSGGFGFVFGGSHRLLGKQVAIKVLRSELASDATQTQRFLREAQTSSQLHHENIVNVSDFGFDEALKTPFVVMERLFGEQLSDLISRSAPLPTSRVIPILLQLARALAEAHSKGVVHRDLKPQNVLLVRMTGRGEVVKLCDFGLSRLACGDDRITATGGFIGTPDYMAPEQIRGEAIQDAGVDWYSFGVTAYQMLAGRLPYDAPTPVALISSKLMEDAKPLDQVIAGLTIPVALEELVMRCIARDPTRRPQSATEVEAVLAALSVGLREEGPGSADLVGQVVGSYRILSVLGRGGTGVVYLGEHPVIGTKVAIKVLLPEVVPSPTVVERFIQEARAANQIGSEQIPRYLDFGHLPSGQPYAVMEFLEGETVAARIERAGRFSVEETAAFVRQVARVMAKAHAVNIIHRDLKPENLLLVPMPDGPPSVKVLDFGIARIASGAGSARLTSCGFFCGTPLYCAPEQLMGMDATPCADVYALGMTAFEMLAGRSPFHGETDDVVTAKTSMKVPSLRTFLPDAPFEVARTLERMLRKEPTQRLASMEEVLRAVDGWHGEMTETLLKRPVEAKEIPRRRIKFQWELVGAVAGALVVAGLLLLAKAPSPVAPSPVVPSQVAPTAPAVQPQATPILVPAAPAPMAPAPIQDERTRTKKPVVTLRRVDRRERLQATHSKKQRRRKHTEKPKRPGSEGALIVDPFQ